MRCKLSRESGKNRSSRRGKSIPMRNTIITIAILFVAVIAASVFYFTNLNRDSRSKDRLYEHVPDDAVFLVSFRHDELLDEIFSGYSIFKAIMGNDQINQLNQLRRDLLEREPLASYTQDQDILISFHPGAETVAFLVFMQLGKSANSEYLYKQISEMRADYTLAWIDDSLSHDCFSLFIPGFENPFYITAKDGIAALSFSESLIHHVFHTNTPTLSRTIVEEFRKEDDEKAPVKLHVNQKNLFGFGTSLMREKPGDYLALLDGLDGYASLYMNYKSDALMFSGFSSIDSSSNYIALYAHQQPVAQTLKNMFPVNTASYISFGISDFPSFHSGILRLLERRKVLAQMREQHRLIENNAQVTIDEDLLPLWGDEFAVVELANRESLAIFKITDSLDFATTIEKISTSYPDGMYRLNHSNLLYYAFGDPLQAYTRPYFMLINDYFVAANHTGTLRNFRENLSLRRTLASTLGYLEFDELQANVSNIAVFVHQEHAKSSISGKLKNDILKQYNDTANFGYSNFYAWSLQLSGGAENFFANLYAKYINREAPGTTPEWTFDLNGQLAAPPFVFEYNDTSRFILAQSTSNILYAIDPDGQRLWNAQLPGPILGKAYQLRDSSIVLTTAERLYRFDTDGSPKPGFSVELPHKASYGITVYESDDGLYIFVPAANRMLAYNADGKVLPGWRNKTLTGNVVLDVKTTAIRDIKYVVAATDIGRVYWFNHNGNLISMKEHTQGFQNPPGLVINDENPDQSYIVITDTIGGINRFSFGQTANQRTQGSWSSSHFFDVVNISGNATPELVFADNRQLAVYQYTDSNLVFHYDFGQEITVRPVFFPTTQGKYRIGIATVGNRLIYVFNEDGTLADGFPIEGMPSFYYGPLRHDGQPYLIVTKGDRKLYLFRLRL